MLANRVFQLTNFVGLTSQQFLSLYLDSLFCELLTTATTTTTTTTTTTN